MAELDHWNTTWQTFADPKWGNCRFDRKALRKGYEHAAIQDYTRRWNKVLRHDIGHSGKSASSDGLGWVSVEEFLRNDHAWPLDEPKAYNCSTRSYNEDVTHERRRTLMQGYWYTLNCRPIKRRLMIVAQYVLPSEKCQKSTDSRNPKYMLLKGCREAAGGCDLSPSDPQLDIRSQVSTKTDYVSTLIRRE